MVMVERSQVAQQCGGMHDAAWLRSSLTLTLYERLKKHAKLGKRVPYDFEREWLQQQEGISKSTQSLQVVLVGPEGWACQSKFAACTHAHMLQLCNNSYIN